MKTSMTDNFIDALYNAEPLIQPINRQSKDAWFKWTQNGNDCYAFRVGAWDLKDGGPSRVLCVRRRDGFVVETGRGSVGFVFDHHGKQWALVEEKSRQ